MTNQDFMCIHYTLSVCIGIYYIIMCSTHRYKTVDRYFIIICIYNFRIVYVVKRIVT